MESLKNFTLLNLSGETLKKSISKNINAPADMDSFASRLAFYFYAKGLVIAANLKSRIKSDEVPNPSLLVYELK